MPMWMGKGELSCTQWDVANSSYTHRIHVWIIYLHYIGEKWPHESHEQGGNVGYNSPIPWILYSFTIQKSKGGLERLSFGTRELLKIQSWRPT